MCPEGICLVSERDVGMIVGAAVGTAVAGHSLSAAVILQSGSCSPSGVMHVLKYSVKLT
jgi:hypothetical protein